MKQRAAGRVLVCSFLVRLHVASQIIQNPYSLTGAEPLKAILFDQPGGPEALRYGDAPDPQPGAGELLVRVRATAVNRADTLQRRGGYPPPEGASPILGLELAGEVIEGAGDWRPGDRVMAVVTGGGYAELATVPAGMAMRIPQRLSFEQAA